VRGELADLVLEVLEGERIELSSGRLDWCFLYEHVFVC
jgi:hypothetical protein